MNRAGMGAERGIRRRGAGSIIRTGHPEVSGKASLLLEPTGGGVKESNEGKAEGGS